MKQEKRRRSIRLPGYDYGSEGFYFVTVCVKDRRCVLGEIKNEEVELSGLGEAVKKCWEEIPKHFPNVILDEYIIMPNHIHGIIHITEGNNHVGVQNFEPLHERINAFQKIIPRSLGSIIRGFKIGVTKWAKNNNFGEFSWQRNYYEHIVRDEDDLNAIREYIRYNPIKWSEDHEHPDFLSKKS